MSPFFGEEVAQRVRSARHFQGIGPFEAVERFKKICKRAAKYTTGKTGLQSPVATMTAGLVILRELLADEPNRGLIREKLEKCPALERLIDLRQEVIPAEPLEEFISKFIVDHHDPELRLAPDELEVRRPAERKQSTLEEAKTFLPNDSLELTHFIDENEECISDVGEMEEMACAFWGKLYAKPEAPSPGKIEQWFNQYRRRIPDGQAPVLPTIEDVTTAIRKSNNSCAGPDGVIFAVYRNKRIIETAAELLHAALCELANGVTPPDGYNHASMYLLPKISNPRVENTRPISVTNADNRIVSATIKNATQR